MLSDYIHTYFDDPLHHNIFITCLIVLYLEATLRTSNWLRDRLGLIEGSRKLVHFAAASWILFWPLYDETHGSWRLNVFVPAAMTLKLIYKGAILNDPNDSEVKNMTRHSNPSELLYGPLHFACLMVLLGLKMFMTEEAAIIMGAVGIGDGMGALIGMAFGRYEYKLPFSAKKTIEGSVFGVFLGTIFGCIIYPAALGYSIMSWKEITILSLMVTAVEAGSLGNFDNIALPIAIHYGLDSIKAIA